VYLSKVLFISDVNWDPVNPSSEDNEKK